MKEVTVIGAGSWGTAIAVVLAHNCQQVTLWTRRDELCRQINSSRENSDYLPGVKLPANVVATADLSAAVNNKEAIVLVVPSHTVRSMVQQIAPLLKNSPIMVSCAKGLEESTLFRMSEVIEQEMPGCRLAVLSGPNHAEEVGRLVPSATVVSSRERRTAEAVQELFMTQWLRVYTNPDIIGVELGGSLKNVIAVAAGIADGLSYGDNTKAALMTRGISEIARLGMQMGAEALTFAGLSGIGDLMVTCTSRHSRNRKLGFEIGKGRKLDEVVSGMRMVAEGVRTTHAARDLAQRYEVEVPITEQVYQVLFYGKDPHQAVIDLFSREKTYEMEEQVASNLKDW
ncbi:MAG: NAD(P)H-dependent glycerol-3-phosphate dehydrogenase [Dethiobacteraceae bacterium]|jgi:glycerol-3-phosphate dehydrogenase (NAD(P)+)|nr:NAD(P)H-dependent glycerol-3-phosphate dehydrogenase [Bacillota bacterium]